MTKTRVGSNQTEQPEYYKKVHSIFFNIATFCSLRLSNALVEKLHRFSTWMFSKSENYVISNFLMTKLYVPASPIYLCH